MPRPVRQVPVLGTILAALSLLLLPLAPALAAGKGKFPAPSPIAQELRKQGDLVPFEPSPAVLAGYFVADEAAPALVYGPVRDFAQWRICPTSWFIESGEKARVDKALGAAVGQGAPIEYTLVLEEDCDDRVTQYSFVFLSSADPKAWLAWREQFHKSKTGGHYGEAVKRLGKAAADGYPVSGDLRFLSVNGELSLKPVEEALKADRKARPVYDLNAGRKLAR